MLNYLNPLTWLRWLGQFLFLWMLSIPWRELPKAIPAMVLVVVLFTAGMVAWNDDSGWRNRLMNKQLQSAWEIDDFPTAELVLRRQMINRPDDLDIAYNLAVARDKQLQHEDALAMMRRLVAGWQNQKAARYLINSEYIGKNWADLTAEQRDEFGSLLKLLYEKSPDRQIKTLYADYLIVAEKLESALPLLEELALSQPMRGLQAAAIARRLGRFPTADRFAEECLEAVKKMSHEDPTNAMLAMAVAQNQLFLKRYADAVRTLRDATNSAKTPEDAKRLNQAMGDAVVAWVGFIEESPNDTPLERARVLRMLEFALSVAPNNPRVLTVVADQVLNTLQDDDEEIARRRKALIAGSAPGIQHFIEGTSALMKDDTETAVMHLQIAAKLMPRSGAIMNNLAVALAARPDADLQHALKISNLAIEQTPNASPFFYETRGQILYRLDRPLEAIPDLTRALTTPSIAPAAHETLAKCYQDLGKDELSKEHAAAAKRIAAIEAAKQ